MSSPYSKLYVFEIVLYGNLPFLRIGTKPKSRLCASADPKINPLASMATILSSPLDLYLLTIVELYN